MHTVKNRERIIEEKISGNSIEKLNTNISTFVGLDDQTKQYIEESYEQWIKNLNERQ